MKKLTEQEYIDDIKNGIIQLYKVPEDCRSYKICMAAVEKNGYNLEFVKNQTKEMCLAAVSSRGAALEHVDEQNEEICIAAMRENGLALRFVKNQTDRIIRAALESDFENFIDIDANVYKYDKNDIINAYDSINDADNFFITRQNKGIFLNKVAEVLNKLSNECLAEAVYTDLKEIFIEKNLKISEELFNIKSKTDMIVNSYDASKINVINKKPKII